MRRHRTRTSKSARARVALTLLIALVLVAAAAYGVHAAAAKPDFALGATPASQSVARGSSATYTVSVNRTGGFSASVALSVNGALPTGVTASFSPNPVSGSTSNLTITTSSSTPLGTYSLTLKGASGNTTRTTTVSLTVTAPPPSGTFSLGVSPSSQTVAAGTAASYAVSINRTSFTGNVTLAVVSGLPAGATASFSPNPASGSSSTLSVLTDSSTTPDGTYALSIRGTSGSLSATTSTTLVVSTPQGSPFTISGDVSGSLYPGLTKPLNLSVSNPFNFDLSITNLTVAVTSISAPNADAGHPCTVADYTVQQFSGTYPFKLAASRTRSLGDLGVADAQWPQIGMLDRPVNQDGCKGATLTLSYTGSARKAG